MKIAFLVWNRIEINIVLAYEIFEENEAYHEYSVVFLKNSIFGESKLFNVIFLNLEYIDHVF